MICANCKLKLENYYVGKISISHCRNCGGSFFEANQINEITLKDALKLSNNKSIRFNYDGEKFCPRDNNLLIITSEESIPLFVTILKCKKCGGIFTLPDDLVSFKRAQQAKIHYFKSWRKPFPALKSVAVYGMLVFLTASLYYFNFRTKDNLPNQINVAAKSICIDKINIIKSNSQYLVTCVTESKLSSKINIRCDNQSIIIKSSSFPSKIHYGSFSLDCTAVRFLFFHENTVIESEWFNLP